MFCCRITGKICPDDNQTYFWIDKKKNKWRPLTQEEKYSDTPLDLEHPNIENADEAEVKKYYAKTHSKKCAITHEQWMNEEQEISKLMNKRNYLSNHILDSKEIYNKFWDVVDAWQKDKTNNEYIEFIRKYLR